LKPSAEKKKDYVDPKQVRMNEANSTPGSKHRLLINITPTFTNIGNILKTSGKTTRQQRGTGYHAVRQRGCVKVLEETW
jgi:hypothetical protein